MKGFDFFIDLPKFDEAVCATIEDKDYFFPDGRVVEAERLQQLKQLCGSCIHEKECLEYALEKQIPYGIWGGQSPSERISISVQSGKIIVIKGMALDISNLRTKGLSVIQIAEQLGTSPGYVRRVFKRVDANDKGEIQSNQKINKLSKGLD